MTDCERLQSYYNSVFMYMLDRFNASVTAPVTHYCSSASPTAADELHIPVLHRDSQCIVANYWYSLSVSGYLQDAVRGRGSSAEASTLKDRIVALTDTAAIIRTGGTPSVF